LARSAGGSFGRIAILAVLMVAAGWAAFTAWERLQARAATAPAGGANDAALEGFVQQGQKHLLAGDLEAAADELKRAAGRSETDPRVQEMLAMAEVMRAERTYWQIVLAGADDEDRDRLLGELDREVDRARGRVAEARKKVTDEGVRTRLELAERRLDAMLLTALTRAGKVDRAREILGARLVGHPQRAQLEAFVAGAGSAAPAASAAPSASASAVASASASAPPKVAPPPYPGHYELDEEPTNPGPPTDGELELPGNR
jgi:hypothetical protein